MKKALILLSGGIDSTTLLYYCKNHLKIDYIEAISYYYGQKHKRELKCAQYHADKNKVSHFHYIDISFFSKLIKGSSALIDKSIKVPDINELNDKEKTQPITYVPFRNTLLLTFAASIAETKNIQDIYYGAHFQDQYGYWDCTPQYIMRLNSVYELNRLHNINIHAPFISMRKTQIIQQGIKLGVDYNNTWSCYEGKSIACGICPTCHIRKASFAELGLEDPIKYRVLQ